MSHTLGDAAMKISFPIGDNETLLGPVVVDGSRSEFSWAWRGVRIDVRRQNRMFGSYANRGTAAKAVRRVLEQEGTT